MWFDPSNPVIALCAEGMQLEGEPARALALFEQAWAMRRDDFEASVAAHFVARHQPSPALTLHWNEIALRAADAFEDERTAALVPSLCLNLADSYLIDGRIDAAAELGRRGVRALEKVPQDGYADFVRMGLTRLLQRVRASRERSSTADAAGDAR